VTDAQSAAPPTHGLVVGVDGSDKATEALAWAIDEARSRDLVVHAVHVWHPPLLVVGPGAAPPITDLEKLAEEDALRVLDEAAAVARSSGVQVQTHAVEGRAAHELVRLASGVDQVVVGERGHSAVRRLLLGSVSSAVAHHATVPTTVVRGVRSHGVRQVVVGVDGSEHSARALVRAALEADARGARLHVVGAWQVVTPDLVGDLGTWRVPPQEDLQEQATVRIQALLDRELPGRSDVTVSVVHDEPVNALLEAANDADLLVVGTRGLGLFERALLGSVAAGCLHHAPCPVQVVPGRRERW
jgi:nucleotide-binding universal stress UspA family protein